MQEQIQLLTLIPTQIFPPCSHSSLQEKIQLLTLIPARALPPCSRSFLQKEIQLLTLIPAQIFLPCSHSSLHKHSHPAHTLCEPPSGPACLAHSLSPAPPHLSGTPSCALSHPLALPAFPHVPRPSVPIPPAHAIPHAWHMCIPGHAPGSSLA